MAAAAAPGARGRAPILKNSVPTFAFFVLFVAKILNRAEHEDRAESAKPTRFYMFYTAKN